MAATRSGTVGRLVTPTSRVGYTATRLPPLLPREPYAVEGIIVSDAVPVPPGYVRLQTVPGEAPASIDAYAMTSPVMLADGYGTGWDNEEIPGRVDATVWTSGKPLRQRVDVLLDRLNTGGNVEDEWRILEHLCRPARGARPPRLRLVGPWLHTDLAWVLTMEPATDPDLWVWDRGRLVRAGATLELQQHVTVDLAERVSGKDAQADPQRREKTNGKETIKGFAKRTLGSARRAREVADLNGIKDTNRKPKAGTLLRLPDKS
jgi:hypothetical protein